MIACRAKKAWTKSNGKWNNATKQQTTRQQNHGFSKYLDK